MRIITLTLKVACMDSAHADAQSSADEMLSQLVEITAAECSERAVLHVIDIDFPDPDLSTRSLTKWQAEAHRRMAAL